MTSVRVVWTYTYKPGRWAKNERACRPRVPRPIDRIGGASSPSIPLECQSVTKHQRPQKRKNDAEWQMRRGAAVGEAKNRSANCQLQMPRSCTLSVRMAGVTATAVWTCGVGCTVAQVGPIYGHNFASSRVVSCVVCVSSNVLFCSARFY